MAAHVRDEWPLLMAWALGLVAITALARLGHPTDSEMTVLFLLLVIGPPVAFHLWRDRERD